MKLSHVILSPDKKVFVNEPEFSALFETWQKNDPTARKWSMVFVSDLILDLTASDPSLLLPHENPCHP
jgi:hypothetical protein